MVHCRSPTKCLKNGHFPSNQIQIVPDSNCCKLFMDNGLPAGANFSPDTSELTYIHVNKRCKCFQLPRYGPSADRSNCATKDSVTPAEPPRIWRQAACACLRLW